MMDTQKIAADLADRLTHSNIKINEPLKHYTYTKTGGKTESRTEINTTDEANSGRIEAAYSTLSD